MTENQGDPGRRSPLSDDGKWWVGDGPDPLTVPCGDVTCTCAETTFRVVDRPPQPYHRMPDIIAFGLAHPGTWFEAAVYKDKNGRRAAGASNLKKRLCERDWQATLSREPGRVVVYARNPGTAGISGGPFGSGETDIPACANHAPRQRRDGKEPWCSTCGLTKEMTRPRSRLKVAQ